jgi:hypothetical protein
MVLTGKGPPKTFSLRLTIRRWDRYPELLISATGCDQWRRTMRCKGLYLRLFWIKCEPTVDGDWNSETADNGYSPDINTPSQ